ncbi:hypothetical protein [Sphingobacterium puteale]|uniref:hypothetical protein n=1 Tax=Sphingobacterium puteale TaxID=2420510 RepID=UPI0016000063|nr:hypothetical protein [Sphingobacterium puteale]
MPKDIMASEVNEDGWYKWKLIPGTMTAEEIKTFEPLVKVGAGSPYRYTQKWKNHNLN